MSANDETATPTDDPLACAADLVERHNWAGPPAVHVLQSTGGPAGEARLDALPVPAEMWADATPAEGLRTVAGAVRAVGMPPGFRAPRRWLVVYRDEGGLRRVTVLDESGQAHTYTVPGTTGGPPCDDDSPLPGRVAAALTAVNHAASGA